MRPVSGPIPETPRLYPDKSDKLLGISTLKSLYPGGGGYRPGRGLSPGKVFITKTGHHGTVIAAKVQRRKQAVKLLPFGEALSEV